MIFSKKTVVIFLSMMVIIATSIIVFMDKKPARKLYTRYTIYQIEYQKRIRREEIFVKDKFNFTIVYYSGNGWQKSDSIIYQKKGECTVIREFLACYDENYSRFKGYRFEACYKDFSDSLTANHFIHAHQYFPKSIRKRMILG
jgi:hypothetical protein